MSLLSKLSAYGKKALAFTRDLAADIVKLRLPVTAGSIVATFVGIVQPFGLDLGSKATALAGILAGIGTAAAALQTALGGVKVNTNPATAQPPVVFQPSMWDARAVGPNSTTDNAAEPVARPRRPRKARPKGDV